MLAALAESLRSALHESIAATFAVDGRTERRLRDHERTLEAIRTRDARRGQKGRGDSPRRDRAQSAPPGAPRGRERSTRGGDSTSASTPRPILSFRPLDPCSTNAAASCAERSGVGMRGTGLA